MKPKPIIASLLAALVAAITIFLRVPIPKSGGYLNLGDVLVVFAGLYLGPKYGMLVGGVGSALADAVGFPIFILPTLLIKGAEGGLSGLFHDRKFRVVGPILGALVMVGGYFIAEALMFRQRIGMAAALTELPFNLIQGAAGVLGGYGLHAVIRNWTKEEDVGVRKQTGGR